MTFDLLFRKTVSENFSSYDRKTGHISPNKGHIYGTSDPQIYESLSEDLLKRQMKFFQDNLEFQNFFESLKNSNKSWGEKNILFQEFLLNNMQKFSQDINPSFIFKTHRFNEAENLYRNKNYKLIEGNLDIDCLRDKKTTENIIAKAMTLFDNNQKITTNYKQTTGHSETIVDICKNIWKDYL